MEPTPQVESLSLQVLRELDRITESPVLHGAESLCRLLNFLVTHTLEHPTESLKEYLIATTLLGRTSAFDPRLDPGVRVQIGRLRSKLIEYYATDGAHDEILIEIPKGSYTPVFRTRPSEQAEEFAPGETANHSAAGRQRVNASGEIKVWPRLASIGFLLLVGAVVGGLAVSTRLSPSSSTVSPPVQSFWRPFLSRNAPPLVVFSNAVFVGDSTTGLRYFDPAHDSSDEILDHYTGTGEVLSIHALDRLFFGMNSEVTVKRGRLLNWDDARNRSVIFVGAPSENLPLRELPWQEDFAFPPLNSPPDHGRGTIVNLHPRNGEQNAYVGVRNAIDYAVICRMGGTGEIRTLMVLAGLTTVGTQAAAEFVCSREGVEKLMASAKPGSAARFSALIQVVIKGGVPFESRLVAFHPHSK